MHIPLPSRHTSLRALLLASAASCCLHAATINAAYWADATTDSLNNYTNSPAAIQIGNSVFGVIPTNASQAQPELDVVNYFRTGAFLPGASTAYDGVLLGNLTGYTGLTATFRINDSALDAGAAFDASTIVGDTYPGLVGSNAGIRLMFMGGYLADGTPNEWWSRGTVAYVTSMMNGQDVTLTLDFDPFSWSNYYGHVGTESADTVNQFDTALAGVTRLGLSFGSGYFFSNGFAFSNGGSANIQLDSIGTLGGSPVPDPSSTPEPATLALLGGALVGLGFFRRGSRSR
ncbi:MAG: PEP-CTERM sorting domain-containing protein [Candidatus Sulfopaludibacter sp.]|nr:PEP-CTERM sorting domain-containing protein [Candidatus Sulfopaludibacter sp.]